MLANLGVVHHRLVHNGRDLEFLLGRHLGRGMQSKPRCIGMFSSGPGTSRLSRMKSIKMWWCCRSRSTSTPMDGWICNVSLVVTTLGIDFLIAAAPHAPRQNACRLPCAARRPSTNTCLWGWRAHWKHSPARLGRLLGPPKDCFMGPWKASS